MSDNKKDKDRKKDKDAEDEALKKRRKQDSDVAIWVPTFT